MKISVRNGITVGLSVFEYFWLLAQKTGSRDEADRFVNSVIYKKPFGLRAIRDTEIWKNNPDGWDRVRLAVGERIAGSQQ